MRLAQGWTGTRDPRDPLRPRRREGRRTSKKPIGFWNGIPGARRRACKRGGTTKPRRSWKGSAAGRHVHRRVVGAPKVPFGEGK
jgi:hypothetical protein